MATRHRGRRPTPDEKKVRLHEAAIKAQQEHRLELQRQLDEADVELARRIDAAINDSVATNKIGAWIVTPEKPEGVSRQMVYKLISEKLPKPSKNGSRRQSPRKRPGSTEGRQPR